MDNFISNCQQWTTNNKRIAIQNNEEYFSRSMPSPTQILLRSQSNYMPQLFSAAGNFRNEFEQKPSSDQQFMPIHGALSLRTDGIQFAIDPIGNSNCVYCFNI